MNACHTRRRGGRAGLTMIEMLVGLGVGALVVAGTFGVFLACLKWWTMSELFMRCTYESSQVLERVVYGAEGRGGLREASEATVVTNAAGWTLTYQDAAGTNRCYQYQQTKGTIVYTPKSLVVGSNVVFSIVVTNLPPDRLTLRVDVYLRDGRFSASNSMSTLVGFRNYHED